MDSAGMNAFLTQGVVLAARASSAMDDAVLWWGTTAGMLIGVLLFAVGILLVIGALLFPWWIRRTMREVIALRREAEAGRIKVASAQQKMLEELRTQTLQLRALVDALRDVQVERE